MGFRFVVLVLAFTGVMLGYITIVCFSVALVSMVKDLENARSNRTFHNDSCSDYWGGAENQTGLQSLNDSKPDTTTFGETYDWDTDTQSFLLGAIFYGCVVMQIPSGILVQHLSMRWTFGLTSLGYSVLNFLIPVAASWGSEAVIAIRVVQGMLQGVVAPIMGQVVSRWFPLAERSRAFSFITCGSLVGSVLGMIISGVFAASETMGGWPSIFYVFGAVGCIFSVLWMAVVYDLPQHHKCVSDAELKIIEKDSENRSLENAPIPWKALLTSVPFWSCSVATAGQIASFFVMATELPIYLSSVFNYDIRSSGILSAVPFLVRLIVALSGSYVADVLRQRNKLSVTCIRKLFNSIGVFGFSLCLAVIAFAGCQRHLIVALLCLSNGFSGVSVPGCLVAIVDISPRFSATTSGIAHTINLASAAVMPYIIGLFISSGHTVSNWSSAFLLLAGLTIATGLPFLIFGSAERQSWDAVEQKEVLGIKNPALETEQPAQVESTNLCTQIYQETMSQFVWRFVLKIILSWTDKKPQS